MTPLLNLPLLEMGLMFVLYFIGAYLLYASFLQRWALPSTSRRTARSS